MEKNLRIVHTLQDISDSIVPKSDPEQDHQDNPQSAPDPSYRALNDIGNSERFVEQHGHRIRYCPDWKCWLVYDETRWVKDSGGVQVHRMAINTVNRIREEATREDLSASDQKLILAHAQRSSSRARIEAMLKLARYKEEITVEAKEFDADPCLLNCQNGTVQLETGELQPHNAADLVTKIVNAPYDLAATCPLFIGFLDRIMGHNKDKVNFLKRALGYSLTGLTREQCLFIFYGTGANGKSTLVEIFRELLLDYAMHTTSDSLLHSRSSPIRNDLARLNGARFVSAVEIGMRRKLDEALVKQLTGGDQVTARRLYHEYFEFKPEFKLFISANHKPEIRGMDSGIWRRIYLIPFDVTIAAQDMDRDLLMKLKGELPGILAWAVQGCKDWQSQGLNPPNLIKRATADYWKEVDVLRNFFEDMCVCESTSRVTVRHLYKAYRTWCDDNCLEFYGIKIFGSLMRQKGFGQSKSGSNRFWIGIRLRNE